MHVFSRWGLTFRIMGRTSSFFDDVADAASSPLGKCESGTRTGLCLRAARFFWDLPIVIARNRARYDSRRFLKNLS